MVKGEFKFGLFLRATGLGGFKGFVIVVRKMLLVGVGGVTSLSDPSMTMISFAAFAESDPEATALHCVGGGRVSGFVVFGLPFFLNGPM